MVGNVGFSDRAAISQRLQDMAQRHERIEPVRAEVQPVKKAHTAPAVHTAPVGGGRESKELSANKAPLIPDGFGPEDLATRTRVEFPGLGYPLAEFEPEEDDFFRSLGLTVESDEKSAQPLPGEGAEEERFRTVGTPFGKEEKEKYRFPWEDDEDKKDAEGVDGVKDKGSPQDVADEGKCQTCAKRKYKDGSNDPGVSFKFATKIDPKAAQAAVRGHEMEHVVRERAKARLEGRKVVSQSVTYHTGICPECGKFYVRGGTTRTVTAPDRTKDILSSLHNKSSVGADFDFPA